MSYHPTISRRRKFRRLLSLDGRVVCWYCRAVIDVKQATIDHAVPLSRGGADRWENYRMCCGPCNWRKGGLTESEYREERAGLARKAGTRVCSLAGKCCTTWEVA
jgi:5-methylcytosine-specific restriction endonuclease McrA